MSWVVLEGADGTGKTTVAEQLRQRGWLYQHAGPEDNLRVLASRMAQLQGLSYVVWDRCHLGEYVYGTLDRHTQVDRGWWNLIEAFLLEKNATCVLMTEQFEDKLDYLGKNGRNRYEEVTHAYARALANSSLTWKSRASLPDYQVDNLDVKAVWEWREDPEGLGGITRDVTDQPVFPTYWVLGEQQNPLAEVAWPFATRCGIELVWPVIDPRDIRVSNALRANQVLDPGDLHDRWEQLGCPQVIALGKVAQNACHRADVEVHETLPHPQFHLRFQAHEGGAYRAQLEGALAL